MFKVWKFIGNKKFASGCAVIVASTKYEAYLYLSGYDEVAADLTDVNHCEEIKELYPSKDLKEPKIIICNLTD